MTSPRPRIRPMPIGAVVACIASAVLVVAGSQTESTATQGGGSTAWGLLLLAGVLALVAGAIAYLLFSDDREATAVATRLAAEPDSVALIDRWLRRARFARNLGGLAGLIVWVGTWTNGMNGSTLVVCGMGGVLLGAVASELHRARPVAGPRTASLRPRTIASYLVSRDQRRTVILTAAWIATGWVAFGADSNGALWLSGLAIATLAGVRVLQWRIAARPRPALPDRMLAADDLVRELAITRGLAQPSNTFVLALFVPTLPLLDASPIGPWVDPLIVVAFVLSVWWWAKNKRLGLDWLLDRPSLSADADDLHHQESTLR